MGLRNLPGPVRTKIDLLFEGIRYTDSLGEAGKHSFPNFYPYRFQPGERDPTGTGAAVIPYLLSLEDGTFVRVRGEARSPWFISGSRETGYRLSNDDDPAVAFALSFEPLAAWMRRQAKDGSPMAQAGVSLHCDMAVVNVAPGCEYFQAGRELGGSYRCSFCAYGAPDARSQALGQVRGEPGLPEATYSRMQDALAAAIEEQTIRHIYLVGGSMVDWALEGERYVALARRVQEVVKNRIPVSCGSGALPVETLRRLRGDGLVDAVCFNLEAWSEPLFSKIAPGKQRFVGYSRWLDSLEKAVELWGVGNVYSAMVAGIELKPEYGLGWESAARLALTGAEELCGRGVLPIYSLYFPVGGTSRPGELVDLRRYFEEVLVGYHRLRSRLKLRFSESFMCYRCSFMQFECDIDRFREVDGQWL